MIASGWWSCPSSEDTRDRLIGSDSIRDIAFHQQWNQAIRRYSNPEEIVIIDSNSPQKPDKVEEELWISLRKNFGHGTNHKTLFCGYTRSWMMSMIYCFANDYDYWVFIEQDALIFGDGIVEETIKKSEFGVFLGDGKGTPQPIQQSMMVFHKNQIIPFLNNYFDLQAKDSEIPPEWKFVFCLNRFAKWLPTTFLKWLVFRSDVALIRKLKKLLLRVIQLFNQFDKLPYGYGRTRPINFKDRYFYFQHGTEDELIEFKKMQQNESDKL